MDLLVFIYFLLTSKVKCNIILVQVCNVMIYFCMSCKMITTVFVKVGHHT